MSEIVNPLVARNSIRLGSTRPSTGWESLRLVVHRNNSEWLTCALIETTWAGASALDSRVAGLQTTWFPERNAIQDLRHYALSRALLALTQTRR